MDVYLFTRFIMLHLVVAGYEYEYDVSRAHRRENMRVYFKYYITIYKE